MTLGEKFQPRHNALNALRLLLATLVVVSHAWPLTGVEPFDWRVADAKSMTAADCEAIVALQPAVVILGTGPKQVFPPREVLAAFLTRRIGVEFMDNAAAARTYNVLLGEGRKVAAGFILG